MADGDSELRQLAFLLRQLGNTLREVATIRNDSDVVCGFAERAEVLADDVDFVGLKGTPAVKNTGDDAA